MMHQGVFTKTKANSFFPTWVRQRELRQRLPLGHSDVFYKSLYSSISPCNSWDGGESSRSEHGGLYCLEFSPDGSLLVAGCCKDSFLMFDPLSQKLIRAVHNAHDSTVTQVKFLDSRIFATGGVDGTISLWDTRNLKSRFRTLLGHAYMIGNIEFSRKNDLLITSALDGIICIWDMKNLNQMRESHKKTFWSNILLRLRLNPDESKMIISKASGYLLIVHELDLNTLAQDLDEFQMEMFGFAHLTISTMCQNWSRSVSQNRRRNIMEKVADFPNGDGGFHRISALEVHPHGWSVFSRSAREATKQEWICVHDIQDRESSESGAAPRRGSGDERPSSPHDDPGTAKRLRVQRITEEKCSASEAEGGTGSLRRTSEGFCIPSTNDSDSELPDADTFSLERGARKRRSGTARTRSPPPGPSSDPPHPLELDGLGSNPAPFPFEDPSLSRFNSCVAQYNKRVCVRFPRLTHFIEEPYYRDWYTDSLGVSADGRLVCSAFRRGIRCLAFSPECSEQSFSLCGIKPRPLYELSTHTSHSKSVICTKISPRHCVLVSGSLDGELAWYQPVV